MNSVNDVSNVNGVSGVIAPNNSTGFDHFRALALDEDIVGMWGMLDAGYGVNTTNSAHESVFIHCCANNRLRAAKFLAGRGADVNLPDGGGGTPLDWAARHASREFEDWLAGAGGRRHASTEYARPAAPG